MLVALNLRTAVAALSPIFDRIGEDIYLDSVGIGLLGTLPPLCFAVFGLLTPIFRRRFRLETLTVIALATMTLGGAVRGIADSYTALALGSVVTFAAMGVGNVVLPPLIKKYFPDRIGLLTGVYSTAIAIAALVPPLLAVPVSDAAGWRISIGVWAALSLVALLPWIALWLGDRRRVIPEPDANALPVRVGQAWRSPLAWALALMFGTTSLNVYALFSWLPEMLTDIAGVSPATAGLLLSLYAGMGLPASLVVPILAVRLRSVKPLIIVGLAVYLLGYAGLIFSPAAGTWLWVALAGFGPLLFPLSLVLINLRTRTSAGSVALSGFTQGIGYLLGALGPLVVGVLHQVTGAWLAPLLFLVATLAVIAVTGAVVARPRMLEDDWHPRA